MLQNKGKKLNQDENRTTTYICISTVNIFGEKEVIFFYHSGTLKKVRNSFLHVWLFVLNKIKISFGIW